MNGLAGVAHVLEHGINQVQVDAALGARAQLPIGRMLAFTAALKKGQPVSGLIPNIGAA
jgi:quinolinate synthase